ncbi:uncharacterized protein BCR38DRAFT_88247 [Pseudomassariella vexata]|uniref:Filamentation protein n=1 Tax=Pseudomassariella vexata TaxID=1141098 RepID=A0A1Y2EDB8_9PEZI|nr:uncharacterized protein BCR38DRAFT_88247 [Pseudomassariella vexata]ORY69573.1 hypothetical protein BCR38DRAFT_88247 [Pseudomassariella vexata]
MPKPAKDLKYLNELNDARCEDNWDSVPELVRKVRKHAPSRECLAVTAETEHAITTAQPKQASASRPTTAASTKDLEITRFLPKLLDAIDNEQSYLEDRFQAQVCVGWLYWTVGEYELAAARLPQSLDEEFVRFEQTENLSEWTRVCTLKAAYLRACCLSKKDDRIGALTAFESALVSLSSIWTAQKGRAQLQFWAELFLTEFCMLQAQALERGEKTLEDSNSLGAFRSWARYFESSRPQGTPLVGGRGFRGAVPRRRVWNEYYSAISGILELDLPFPTGYVTEVAKEGSARGQLRMELKKVESTYEALLLMETAFPRAEEDREEVEDFVGRVMRNWSILSGRDWYEHDLGPGGKEGLSRGVLEILYRAATKTFHSTAILRHLFTVHLAVAEFDLAFKAFDSYLEIVKKGKARVDKTGHLEPSLDDDGTVLETMSTAITALCKYGLSDAAEKARDLGIELEEMLSKLPAPLPNADDSITTLDEETANGVVLHPRLTSRVNALAWQAIGLSQAQWSRTTYDAAARVEIQAKAIRSFQKSLSPDTGNPTDVRTLFTLGLLLAEQRELSAAIDIVKAALMSNKKTGEQNLSAGSYWRERSLIPVWHLLALLLSARQDYIMAARACEGAFEQFDDPTVLFGTPDLDGNFRSDHLNEVEAKDSKPSSKGLVDEMDDLEKEVIIEVKMTQLAILEILEGPEVAVNASHELLVLYTRLFGSLQPSSAHKSTSGVPKSSAGTLRSLRGSIFGNKSEKAAGNLKHTDTMNSERSAAGKSDRPQTATTTVSTATTAPTIHVTKENGDARTSRSRRSSVASSVGRRSNSTKRCNSLKKRDRSVPQRQRSASSSGGLPRRSTISDGDAYFTPLGDGAANERPDFFAVGRKNSFSSQQSFSRGRGLLRFDSNVSSNKESADMVLDSLTPPNPLPLIQFPKEQLKRQRQSILIKVWLMIGAFYRRSHMYTDCRGSIEEARLLVDAMEADLFKDTGSSVTTNNPGWGGRQCIEELWSDVRSETGYLLVAEEEPYEARAQFEEALMHYPNHPAAIVGLSNILLDIYSEALLPTPAIPGITLPDGEPITFNSLTPNAETSLGGGQRLGKSISVLPTTPLGLGTDKSNTTLAQHPSPVTAQKLDKPAGTEELRAPYKAASLPMVDRLAARDRAYGLLSGLTKLGSGWNYSDAWFALARAHEESGQAGKAKEALWWCVELEEGMGVRDWNCVGVGGYVL